MLLFKLIYSLKVLCLYIIHLVTLTTCLFSSFLLPIFNKALLNEEVPTHINVFLFGLNGSIQSLCVGMDMELYFGTWVLSSDHATEDNECIHPLAVLCYQYHQWKVLSMFSGLGTHILLKNNLYLIPFGVRYEFSFNAFIQAKATGTCLYLSFVNM